MALAAGACVHECERVCGTIHPLAFFRCVPLVLHFLVQLLIREYPFSP